MINVIKQSLLYDHYIQLYKWYKNCLVIQIPKSCQIHCNIAVKNLTVFIYYQLYHSKDFSCRWIILDVVMVCEENVPNCVWHCARNRHCRRTLPRHNSVFSTRYSYFIAMECNLKPAFLTIKYALHQLILDLAMISKGNVSKCVWNCARNRNCRLTITRHFPMWMPMKQGPPDGLFHCCKTQSNECF